MDQAQELSEGGFEMLRAAVNTAREHQCRSVGRLRERLLGAYPNRSVDIDEAISFWSADVRRLHTNGVAT